VTRDRPPAPSAPLRAVLCGQAGREPVAAALTAAGIELVPDGADIVVLCVDQPSRETLEEADRLRAANHAPVLLVIGELPTPYLIRTVSQRLEGAVLRADASRTLGPAIAAVCAGQSAHPLAFREHLELPLLSPREKQVLAMVVLGLANVEIAAKLFVTEASIKAHLTSAFAKLGVRSREAAAAIILDPDYGYGPGILRITTEDASDPPQR
jgi:DNA-binding NarL/FixJ family response regulator